MGVKCPKCDFENPEDLSFCGKCGTQLPSPEKAEVTETLETPKEELTRGTTLANRYEIIEELGKGGMGRVYRVEDTKLKQEVALKLIKPEIAKDKKTIERFRNELKLARNIRHKNVCGMFDLGETEGTHFITMEYVRGEDLRSLIKRVHRLDTGTAISLAKQVCEGLSEAHRLGIVHRDLKPQNIMVDKQGNALIMDFGIARSVTTKGITDKGMMIGTPEYMSPEQVEAKDIDLRTDIYSLGIILYEMTTGQLPFEADTPFAVGLKQKSQEPQNPKELNSQIPDELNNLIMKCLKKDKEQRFQSAGEVRSELECIEEGIPTAKPATPKKKPLTSKEISVSFTLKKLFMPVLILICGTVIGLLIWQPWKKERAAPIAPEKPSLIVLPFDDLSPLQGQEHFSIGLTDEIITKLSKIHSLDVISQRSSMMLRGTTKDAQTIAKELNVRYVLEGSVRIAENTVRITAKLIDTLSNMNIWADDYSRSMDDIFDVQEKIAASLVSSLEIELTSEEQERLTEQPISNVLAYEYYLKARQEIWGWTGTEGLEQALEYLQNGLEIVGENVHIYAGMGYVYYQFYNYGDDSARIKAEKYAQKVFELEPDSPYGHLILGLLDLWQNPPYAFQHLKKVLASDPNNYDALVWMGYVLIHIGKTADGQLLLERALKINPLAHEIQQIHGWIQMFSGQANLALESMRKFYESHSNSFYAQLGYIFALTLTGHNDKAAKVIEEEGISDTLYGALKYAMEGNEEEVLHWISNLKPEHKAYYRRDFQLSWILSRICSLIGEKDMALEWLEQAVNLGFIHYHFLNEYDPLLNNIRGEERFKKLMERVKKEWETFEF